MRAECIRAACSVASFANCGCDMLRIPLRRIRMSMDVCVVRRNSSSSSLVSHLSSAERVVFVTGAGISAESGIPTFRGSGGLWRELDASSLASPAAFASNPGLVWQFYHYRRQLVLSKRPNRAHASIADFEERHAGKKHVAVITQNVDELHSRAGSKNVLELHGSLFRTRCTVCNLVESNYDSPINETLDKALKEKLDTYIEPRNLPRCNKVCDGLLRPDIVWFGESLDSNILNRAVKEVQRADVCLVIGTSSLVYPAAGLTDLARDNDVLVAEFNVEQTPASHKANLHFQGKCGDTLPHILRQVHEHSTEH